MKTKDITQQEITNKEMKKLSQYLGKKIIVHGIHEGRKFEEVRTLVDINPYVYIATWNGTIRRRIQFIGPNSGILKITEKPVCILSSITRLSVFTFSMFKRSITLSFGVSSPKRVTILVWYPNLEKPTAALQADPPIS